MKRLAIVASVCVLLAGVGQASAQDRTRETTTVRTERLGTVIMGASVTLQAGGGFGKVYDFVISEDGCIEYIVILEQTNYVFVPWTAITFNLPQRALVINVTRERLRDVTFTKDKWPNVADAQFRQRVQTVFGDGARRRTDSGRDVERQPPTERRDPPKRAEPPKRTDPPKADPPKDPPKKDSPKKVG